jgi:hypothetical protein
MAERFSQGEWCSSAERRRTPVHCRLVRRFERNEAVIVRAAKSEPRAPSPMSIILPKR